MLPEPSVYPVLATGVLQLTMVQPELVVQAALTSHVIAEAVPE